MFCNFTWVQGVAKLYIGYNILHPENFSIYFKDMI